MIERAHLQILREVERQGSLTAAANSLHLSQSALSHSIKKLESVLGTALWIKQGRQLELTSSGKYLLSESKRLLPQLERLDERLLEHAKGELGAIKIGMECHPCYQWLLKVVERFLSAYPKIDVDVKQRFQFGGMAALFNKEIDLLVTPDPIYRKGIKFTGVFDYEQVLIVSKEHPLASRKVVAPEDLTKETLYTYPVDIERLDIYSQFLLPAQCLPRKRKVIEATEIMLQLVTASRGVTTMPRWLADKYGEELPICAISLGPKGIQKTIHLGTREQQEENAPVMRFLETASSA